MKKKFDELSPFKIIHHDMKRVYPIHIEIDPTAFCNHDCVRCSYTQEIDGVRESTIYQQGNKLTLDRFISLVDEFKAIGIRAVTLSGGGEPLSHPEINSMIKAIDQAGIEFGVITNLSLKIDAELLSRAVWVRVSLDAGSTETYAQLHRPPDGEKAFSRVLENMENLRRINPKLDMGVNFIVQPENYNEIFQAARLVKQRLASYIRFVPAITTEKIDYRSIWSEVDRLQKKSLELVDDHFHVFNIKERFDAIENSEKSYSFCYKQQVHPLLGADGNIYPCCLLKYYPKHDLGSVLNRSFKEVWHGEQRKIWLEELDVSKCPSCWFDKTNEFIEYMLDENPKHVNFV